MIEAAYKTEIVKKEAIDTENSHVYCDHCDREIPMNSKFYHICTGHNDWGNDSSDSIEYKQICSSDGLVDYITYNYTEKHGLHKNDTQHCDIEKRILTKSYIETFSKDI